MNKFQFTPPNGLLDISAYPTNPSTESEARRQIQDPLNQLKDFINLFVDSFVIDAQANGRIEFPNGLIIQWGRTKGWNGGQIWVPFSKPFPKQVLNIQITSTQSGAATAINTIHSYLTNGFNFNSSVNNLDVFWIAFGN